MSSNSSRKPSPNSERKRNKAFIGSGKLGWERDTHVPADADEGAIDGSLLAKARAVRHFVTRVETRPPSVPGVRA